MTGVHTLWDLLEQIAPTLWPDGQTEIAVRDLKIRAYIEAEMARYMRFYDADDLAAVCESPLHIRTSRDLDLWKVSRGKAWPREIAKIRQNHRATYESKTRVLVTELAPRIASRGLAASLNKSINDALCAATIASGCTVSANPEGNAARRRPVARSELTTAAFNPARNTLVVDGVTFTHVEVAAATSGQNKRKQKKTSAKPHKYAGLLKEVKKELKAGETLLAAVRKHTVSASTEQDVDTPYRWVSRKLKAEREQR